MRSASFEKISPYLEKPSHSEEPRLTRRSFLKKTGALAAGVALGTVGKMLLEEKAYDLPSAREEGTDDTPDVPVENSAPPSKEQLTIRREDEEVIGKTFTEQLQTQDTITLDRSTRQAIYNRWHERYAPGSYNYEHGLIPALERMRPWMDPMRAEFRAQHVPEEFIYIAIAESHFSLDARSHKSAVGPFQITKHTASLPDLNTPLTITENYDERRDPVLSARLCARHLRYSYEQFGHDWQLALMDYNGGFTNDYLRSIAEDEKNTPIKPQTIHEVQEGETLHDLAQRYNTSITLLKRANSLTDDKIRKLRPGTSLIIPQERTAITFDHFNQWLEDRINTTIQREKERSRYIVKKGDTTSAIAEKFGIQRHLLESLNNITNSFITEGQEIHIPEAFDKRRDRILTILADYRENINYPDKFYAIRDIITENKLDETQTTPEHRILCNAKLSQHNPEVFHHTITPGENLPAIARKFITQIKSKHPQFDRSAAVITSMLAQQNGITNVNKIRAGAQLTLTIPIKKPPTLESVAQRYKLPLQQLATDNPAVIDPYRPLPQKISLRIPG